MDEKGYVLQYRPLPELDWWMYVPGLRWAASQDAAYTLNEIMCSWMYNEHMPFSYNGDRIAPFLIATLAHWHYNPHLYRIVAIESLLTVRSN